MVFSFCFNFSKLLELENKILLALLFSKWDHWLRNFDNGYK